MLRIHDELYSLLLKGESLEMNLLRNLSIFFAHLDSLIGKAKSEKEKTITDGRNNYSKMLKVNVDSPEDHYDPLYDPNNS